MSEDQPPKHLKNFAKLSQPVDATDEDNNTIFMHIADAAGKQIEKHQQVPGRGEKSISMNPDTMLGVISYCYAKGVYRSEEIEIFLWKDEAFLETYGNLLPSAEDIKRFRMRYREEILKTLDLALKEFWRHNPNPPKDLAKPTAEEMNTAMLSREEAKKRVDNAVFRDHLDAE